MLIKILKSIWVSLVYLYPGFLWGQTESAILPLNSDSVSADSIILAENILNPDSLLSNTFSDDIIIPYRSNNLTETYPAHDLYKVWDHEFLTPKSFSKNQLPDQYNIDLVDFHFPAYGEISSPFGYRKPRQHYGVDLKITSKDTIRAAFAGKVRIERYEPRGYGYYLVIRHSNGLETIYGHLAKFLVKVNQYVAPGEPIALGDNTGRSSGPHLHFETRFMGTPINPASLIDFNSKSLLAQTYLYTNPNKKIVRSKTTPVLSPKT